jgi:DNA repair exonuclease SbcCD ATPase subunit
MTGQPYTLAAILVRLTEREQQIEAQAVALRAQIEQLTRHLDELEHQLEHVQITRKTLADLPEPDLPSAPAVTQDPPEHPAYEQILAVLAAADQPKRAREVTVAIDLPTTATNVNNVRHKLKRLTSRNLIVEVERGLFAAVQA